MIAKSQKIEQAPKIHEEIFELEKKLAEKKQELAEKQEFEKHDKDILREVVKERISQVKVSTKPPAPQIAKKAKEIGVESKERQIQLLIDLVFQKGVEHAIEVARRLDNPYLLDELHDSLVDKLYKKLVEEGKLKKI